NNKAPACESRGFVRKKQKVCILTHLHFCYTSLILSFQLDTKDCTTFFVCRKFNLRISSDAN
ncbi:hypothetical protein GA421_07815, partial [Bacteroides xylanisolvens]